MKILIVAATKLEIEPLLNRLSAIPNSDNSTYSSTYRQHSIDIVITGIGMVSTTYYTSKYINSNYNLALNIGICGSFNKNLEIGTIVNIYEDCFAELGAEDDDKLLTIEDMGMNGIQSISNLKLQITNTTIENLPKVNGITVNRVHGSAKSIEKIYNKFHPITESMEGAAFMFVCEKEKIPYIQIRAVSNFVEKRNKENWNIPLAVKNVNEKIVEIIDSF